MNMKKLVALLLAVMLVGAVVVGCGEGTSSSQTSSSSAVQSQSGDAAGGEEREMVGNMYVEGFPIVKEPVTYKILISGAGDPYTMDFWNEYAALTNVNIEWEIYDYATAVEKKNLMYTTGEYYDAIGTWCLTDSDILTYAGDVWVPVDEMVAKYGPNYTNVLDTFPNCRATLTTPDGHIYGFPVILPADDCSIIMHINKSWLDNLGLDVPTTIEEFEHVLREFKEKDANGNGDPNDEIPFSFYEYMYGFMFGSWGIIDERTDHLMIKNDEVIYAPVQDGYKEGIKWLNKLYNEGLIDTESFTQDGTMYTTRGRSGDDSIYGVIIDWTGLNVVGTDRYEEEYISLAPMEGPNGDRMWGQQGNSIFRNQFAITSNAENPEVLVRWIDGLYEEEMSFQVTYGKLGQFTEKRDDGMYTYIDPLPDGMTLDDVRNNHCINSLPYCIMPDFMNDRIVPNKDRLLKKEADQTVMPFLNPEPFPLVWRTPEQVTRVNELRTDILKLTNDMRVAWITGQADIDSDWDNYVDQLNKMGLEEYVNIYKDAYAAYVANK